VNVATGRTTFAVFARPGTGRNRVSANSVERWRARRPVCARSQPARPACPFTASRVPGIRERTQIAAGPADPIPATACPSMKPPASSASAPRRSAAGSTKDRCPPRRPRRTRRGVSISPTTSPAASSPTCPSATSNSPPSDSPARPSSTNPHGERNAIQVTQGRRRGPRVQLHPRERGTATSHRRGEPRRPRRVCPHRRKAALSFGCCGVTSSRPSVVSWHRAEPRRLLRSSSKCGEASAARLPSAAGTCALRSMKGLAHVEPGWLPVASGVVGHEARQGAIVSTVASLPHGPRTVCRRMRASVLDHANWLAVVRPARDSHAVSGASRRRDESAPMTRRVMSPPSGGVSRSVRVRCF